jgi:hypothetical protein
MQAAYISPDEIQRLVEALHGSAGQGADGSAAQPLLEAWAGGASGSQESAGRNGSGLLSGLRARLPLGR